ncbi:MAG TPA: DnaJ domain-containing protein [Desulfohalobiaceae bacterium]|nr:DnaJ domain-containing protein [Desulfohalobiaceae bacterium]
MEGQDYYSILGVSPKASSEEIKKAYKSLAFQYHPDRNPDNRDFAEKKFKEITEAYGILIDSFRRRQYDQRHFSRYSQQDSSFRHSHSGAQFENIFKDMFNNPNASRVFQDLEREFRKHGVRFDKSFFDNLFFGGKGVFFTGFVFFGSTGSQETSLKNDKYKARVSEGNKILKSLKPDRQKNRKKSLINRLAHKLEQFTYKSITPSKQISTDKDLFFNLTIPATEASKGTEVKIAYPQEGKNKRLKVRIPPINRDGTQLRLPNKGKINEQGYQGDLYLRVYLSYD